MEAVITKNEGTVEIKIMGRLDTVTSAELKEQIDGEDISGLDIELDFTEVEYISSAGLRLLVALQKQANSTENKMVVKNINNVVKEIFKVAGFDKALTVI